jgi:hypothetical protein
MRIGQIRESEFLPEDGREFLRLVRVPRREQEMKHVWQLAVSGR